MSSNYIFYRYEGYSYRVEVDTDDDPVAAYVLQPDGTWLPVGWGWQALMVNNSPIAEEEAFLLAGIKKVKPLDPKDPQVPIAGTTIPPIATTSPASAPGTSPASTPATTPSPSAPQTSLENETPKDTSTKDS